MGWNDEKPHNMTGDEYMAKRCLELEQENKELKERLQQKCFKWVIWSPNKKGSFITTINEDGSITIKEIEEK